MKAEALYGPLKKAKSPQLRDAAKSAAGRYREEPHDGYLVEIETDRMDAKAIDELIPILHDSDSGREARALTAIRTYKTGDFSKKVPSFPAFPAGLRDFFRANKIRGWVFVERGGIMYPYALESIYVREANPRDKDDKPSCTLKMVAFGPSGERFRGPSALGKTDFQRTWEPTDVTRKSIPDILTEAGLILETDELLAEHDAHLERFDKDMAHRFAEQIALTGGHYDEDELPSGMVRKAIHDLKMSEQPARPSGVDSRLLGEDIDMPVHPCIKSFDLHSHTFGWNHVSEIEPYAYDKSLREKLVLPRSHRDLLDVLTADLSVFSGDIIKGKSAGNIIVCQGLPGLGKTLTAEVYSELTETPIYAVHSGTMGTTPDAVEKSLKVIFKRQRRWGCLVLLDEADVFVKARGDSIVQNAIVAEFLRTLEYFEGLMFMTTNRPDDIDDAIISRAAAIITYRPPTPSHAIRIWEVMFAQNGVKPDSDLLVALTELFPSIAPRDIKMLLRLVLRVATSKDVPITLDLFRRIAMFRAVEISDKPVELSPSESLI